MLKSKKEKKMFQSNVPCIRYNQEDMYINNITTQKSTISC